MDVYSGRALRGVETALFLGSDLSASFYYSILDFSYRYAASKNVKPEKVGWDFK